MAKTTRNTSLAFRLLSIYTLVVVAALMIVAALVVYLTRQQLIRELDRDLVNTVELFESGPGARVAAPADLEAASRDWLSTTPLPGNVSALVRLPSGTLLASTGSSDVRSSAAGRRLLASDTPSGDRFT
ncbi:MAG TPA: hypothetical protein VFV09_12230, partial [Actinomycetota bacterium]|nr:hypothetical protein [Actinomycetota bacterium]